MRRLAIVAVVAAACGSSVTKTEPGSLDTFFYPTGIGVLDGRIVVASSNADLTYASATGGSVIVANVCEPWPDCAASVATADSVASAVNIESFSGQVGIADPAACAELAAVGRGASVIVPIRGTDFIYHFAADPSGVLSCDGCQIGVGTAQRGDPFAVGIACGPNVARAYVGYLRTNGGSWLTQIDLLKSAGEEGYVRHRNLGDSNGQIRGFAYDAAHTRLLVTRTASGAATWLGWVSLANDCLLDVYPLTDPTGGGCQSGISVQSDLPNGLELRGIALANDASAGGALQRAYLTARIYDSSAAAASGGRIGDFDGLLLVVDLWEDLAGRLRISIVDQLPIGYGAGDVQVLLPRAGKRDVVAALASDDGVLWIYDDDTGARVAIGRSPDTGAPLVGHDTGIAVDPEPLAGNVARVYVGSFRDNYVTPIDVPLDAPETAAPVISGGKVRRIGPQVGVTP